MRTGDNKASVKEQVDPIVDQEKVGQPSEPIKTTRIGEFGIFWNPVQVSILIAPADIDVASSKHFGKKILSKWPDGKEKKGYKAIFSRFNPYVYCGKLGCLLNLNKVDTHDEYKKLARADLKSKGFVEIFQEDLAIAEAKKKAVQEIEDIKKKYDDKSRDLHKVKEDEYLESKSEKEGAMNV